MAAFSFEDAQTPAGPKTFSFEDANIDPTAGMSGAEKFLAGMGKAFYDTGRGVGNLVTDIVPSAANLGFATRKDTDEANARDAPLMNTGAGLSGNILGNIALIAPSVAIPGATTVPGALALGAGLGAMQQVGEKDSRLANTAIGGAASAAIPAAATVYKAGKGLVQPFFDSGRKQIASDMIDRFAANPASVRNAAGELVPGSTPTLAEATQDPGIATLQRSLFASDPALSNAVAGRQLQQNDARMQALKGLGDTSDLDYFKQARGATAQELYAKAFAEAPDSTPWIRGEVTKLMKRPSFVEALKDGQKMAMDLDVPVSPDNPEFTTTILHHTKLALDDSIEKAMGQGNTQKALALSSIKGNLVSMMESKNFSPSYREARDTYSKMSAPVDRLEAITGLQDRVASNQSLVDSLGNPKLTPAAFSSALKGMERNGDLSKLGPADVNVLNNIRLDLSRQAQADNLGRSVGSPTAQLLASQNLLRQIAGPLGIPQSWAEGSILQSAMRPINWLNQVNEPKLRNVLAEIMMDPALASKLSAANASKSSPAWLTRAAAPSEALLALGSTHGAKK